MTTVPGTIMLPLHNYGPSSEVLFHRLTIRSVCCSHTYTTVVIIKLILCGHTYGVLVRKPRGWMPTWRRQHR